MLHAIRVLYFDNFVNYNVVGVDYCLREITADGTCKDQAPFKWDCYGEFMYGVGSWTMAKDCQCQQLSENKRRCQCCVNCDYKGKLLSDAFLDDTHDRCNK